MVAGSRFSDKCTIITGASSGIGRGVAIYFAQEGAKLLLSGRNAEQLEETKNLCVVEGAKAENVVCVVGDVTDDDVPKKLLNAALEAFGKLHILINNAGALTIPGHKTSTISDPIEVYDKLMDINLRSIVQMTRTCIEELKKTKGNIVNVSSISSMVPKPFITYCLYILPWGKEMAGASLSSANKPTTRPPKQPSTNSRRTSHWLDLATVGVRVNSINPGFIKTNLITRLEVNEQLYKKFEESIAISNPLGRFGSIDEIARSVGFLADNRDAGYVTGHSLVVDGGSTLANCSAASHFGRSLSMLP
ncbi:hypothetical protein L596_027641 [Steinernema carpocapsae]|uniref:Uncharacterized protein n=1 Tax=Steinernema carpocapsae TaxID=34508 RepID=A0A4U5LW39_STECR|nr:hypothetical protein L596_027641 [Steinernema carpocapsae]